MRSFSKKAKEIERRLEKITRIKPPVESKDRVRKQFEVENKSGKEVIKVESLGKMMQDRLLFSDSSFMIYRGERIAVMGENGSGKSTLLKMIMADSQPDEGLIKVGDSVSLGYLPQKIIFEVPEKRMIEYAKELMGNEQKAREELARFGFYAADVSKRLKDLSGGEQVRLALLALFQKKINLLILDEPTNHLDIFAREEIEEILQSYTGTLLVVSHDRYFLKKNLTKTLLIENQTIKKYEELEL